MSEQKALPMETNELRKEVIMEICKELGYKGYDDEWGREHLVDGPHGNCYFHDTDGILFHMLIRARMKLKQLEVKA